MDFELVVVAIAPIVFLAWFMYSRDKYEHEPRRLILKTFFVGAVLVVPVIIAELVGTLILPPSDNLLTLFLHFLIVVAFVEESSKYVAVRVSAYGSREFNEPMDGLVYGAIAGLGFAAPENLIYVLSRGVGLGIIRAVLSVPGHALWGAIIGYYLARQKLHSEHGAGLKGLCFAIVLHTLFDYGLVSLNPLLGITIAAVLILASWLLYFRLTKVAITASPFRPGYQRPHLPPPPSQATKYCIYCGTLILADHRFCRSCGAEQP